MFSELLGSWTPRLVIEWVKKLLPSKIKYLDVGCGDGELTRKVATILGALEVYGVDRDERALLRAGRRGITALKCELEAESLPFRGEVFDLITAFEVIEHLKNPLNMLKESLRTLRNGGLIVIETPNASGCASRFIADQLKLTALTGKSLNLEVDVMRAREARGFNPQSLRSTLIEVGFEPIKFYGVTHPPVGVHSFPVMVEELKGDDASSIPHIVAIAKKPL